MTDISDIIDAFSYLSDWEDKYRYLIELGEGLDAFPDDCRTDAFKVEGCMSQVWLVPHFDGEQFTFKADSDASIVKGLIAVILACYNEKTPEQILDVNIDAIFHTLGLEMNLSPTRRNGFFSMVSKINELAKNQLSNS